MNVVWHYYEGPKQVEPALVLACPQGLHDHRCDLPVLQPNRTKSGTIGLAIKSTEGLPSRLLWLARSRVKRALPGQRSKQTPSDEDECFVRMPMRQPPVIKLLAIGR